MEQNRMFPSHVPEPEGGTWGGQKKRFQHTVISGHRQRPETVKFQAISASTGPQRGKKRSSCRHRSREEKRVNLPELIYDKPKIFGLAICAFLDEREVQMGGGECPFDGESRKTYSELGWGRDKWSN